MQLFANATSRFTFPFSLACWLGILLGSSEYLNECGPAKPLYVSLASVFLGNILCYTLSRKLPKTLDLISSIVIFSIFGILPVLVLPHGPEISAGARRGAGIIMLLAMYSEFFLLMEGLFGKRKGP